MISYLSLFISTKPRKVRIISFFFSLVTPSYGHFHYLHSLIAEDIHDLDCNFAPTRHAFTKYALKNSGLLLTLNENAQGLNIDLTSCLLPPNSTTDFLH
jgi:hypothetical protein